MAGCPRSNYCKFRFENVGSMSSAWNSIIDDELKDDLFTTGNTISNVFSSSCDKLSLSSES